VRGEMDNLEILSTVISKSRIIVSLLGPNINQPVPTDTFYADIYRGILPIMRQHGVRRILAMGTISITRPEDNWSFLRWLMVLAVKLIAGSAYKNIIAIQNVFEDKGATRDIGWTVYRIAAIPGNSDSESWKTDRNDGDSYIGPVNGNGWTLSQKRSALTRWLVDAVESGAPDVINKMPAVSRLAGSKVKVD
jgi:hypothetical protein